MNGLVPKLSSIDYSWIRRCISGLDLSPYDALRGSGEHTAVAADASGVSVHKADGCAQLIHRKKKRYIKIHFAVNVDTKEVVSMEITTDDVHDSNVLSSLVDEAEQHSNTAKAYMDSAYDLSRIYEYLEAKGIDPIIKPRKNSRLNAGNEAKRKAIGLYKRLGHKGWVKLKQYGRRWMAETRREFRKRFYSMHIMTC